MALKPNVISLISGLSVLGVTVGTAALIIVLSVFNGFDELIQSLYNSFDPDVKISLVQGKSFQVDDPKIMEIRKMKGVEEVVEIVEENALIRMKDKQYPALIKGVGDNFDKVSNIKDMIYEGEYLLKKGQKQYAVIGQGIAYYLGARLDFVNPMIMYIPKRKGSIGMNPESAFNKKYIFPTGIFRIEQNYDLKYVLTSLDFARELMDYENEVTSLELKLSDKVSDEKVIQQIKDVLGPEFKVLNRFQQNEVFYKIMKTEKWAIFFILTFILIIASFNIVGSLTMLILDKKKDISVLKSLGADHALIKRIFLLEGWLISILGVVLGLVIGLSVCFAQQYFGIIQLKGSGSFVVDAYPVHVKFTDIISIFLTVSVIGFLTAWYPVKFISRKFNISNI